VAHLSLLEHSLSMHNSTNRDLPRLMNRTRRATVWSVPGQVRGRTALYVLCRCVARPAVIWTDVVHNQVVPCMFWHVLVS